MCFQFIVKQLLLEGFSGDVLKNENTLIVKLQNDKKYTKKEEEKNAQDIVFVISACFMRRYYAGVCCAR